MHKHQAFKLRYDADLEHTVSENVSLLLFHASVGLTKQKSTTVPPSLQDPSLTRRQLQDLLPQLLFPKSVARLRIEVRLRQSMRRVRG